MVLKFTDNEKTLFAVGSLIGICCCLKYLKTEKDKKQRQIDGLRTGETIVNSIQINDEMYKNGPKITLSDDHLVFVDEGGFSKSYSTDTIYDISDSVEPNNKIQIQIKSSSPTKNNDLIIIEFYDSETKDRWLTHMQRKYQKQLGAVGAEKAASLESKTPVTDSKPTVISDVESAATSPPAAFIPETPGRPIEVPTSTTLSVDEDIALETKRLADEQERLDAKKDALKKRKEMNDRHSSPDVWENDL